MLSQWFCRHGGFYSFHAVLVAPRGDFIITCDGFKSPLARFHHNLSRFFRRFTRTLPCYKLIFASFADYGNIILRSIAFFNRLFRRRGRVFRPHCSENRAPTIYDHIKTRRSPISLRRVSNSLKLHPLFARISPFDSSIATVFPIVRPTFRLTLCFAVNDSKSTATRERITSDNRYAIRYRYTR